MKLTHFSGWLSNQLTVSSDGRYRHRLIKEVSGGRPSAVIELTKRIENAHEDARQLLRRLEGPTLDPLGDIAEPDIADMYPCYLHIQTLKGYFGEIFAAVVAENLSPFDIQDWIVPAFLFRFHTVAFQYLEAVQQHGQVSRQLPGRTGDDCVAFQREAGTGRIIAVLYCEAKCTKSHRVSMLDDAHEKVSSSSGPVDLLQVIEVLRDSVDSRPDAADWIEAIRDLRWRIKDRARDFERCNLVSYICGRSPVKGSRNTWIATDTPHHTYTGSHRLEAIEVHLTDVENLVRTVYGQKEVSNATLV